MLSEPYNCSQRFEVEGLNVNLVSNDKMMDQYFTAPSVSYTNQEYYVFTLDQGMGSFHELNMKTYSS